jgi:demethylmenaquinone methyltransferase/2-methoxy-6-polyprenyl-1,4-benzoquinol methylase
VESLGLRPGQRVLDVATGTGDLALLIAARHPAVTVVGLDPSSGMLGVARERIERSGRSARIGLEAGDAEALPFEDASFDAATMAFGIRNVRDRPRALRELARVLRPGGRVAILELGEPRGRIAGGLARFHIHTLVPLVGGLLSGAGEYRYLERSIASFPAPETFSRMMGDAGFGDLGVRPFAFGACVLFSGRRGESLV